MAKRRFTKQQVGDAIERAHGMLTGAARFLGCSTRTLLRYLQRYPELEQLRNEARGEAVEQVELRLLECALQGEAWAVQFLLRNWKPEVYGDRARLHHQHEPAPIELNLSDGDRAILYEILQRAAGVYTGKLRLPRD